jgi:aldehyde:ferredoxin oxidoreductase
MLGGIMGKILRVDLTNRKITEKGYPEEYLVKYLGQDGLAARIIYDEVPPEVPALDPESRLVISTGPLAGTTVQSSCDYSVSAKSPLTGFTIYNAHCKGSFAPMLKHSGFDAVIFQGKADKPVYLWINNGKAELKDASHLWGKDTWATHDTIVEELGQPKAGIACIGQAGENLVLIAGVVTDKDHLAARGGLGAVMGSKNLKAVVVYGTKAVPIANPEKFKEVSRRWREDNMANPVTSNIKQFGTAGDFGGYIPVGDVPIKNWSRGTLEGWEKLTGQSMVSTMFKKHDTCPSCTIAHRKVLELKGGEFTGECALPEYEVLVGAGSLIGITEPTAVCHGGQLLDKYGMDALGAGTMIGWAMECYEKGILTKEDVDGLDLRFGNYKAAHEMMRKIAMREGFGNILANGPIPAAEYVGKDSEKMMVHVKGMPTCMHDYRAAWGFGLSYAVASAGPAHEGGPLGAELSGAVPRMATGKKAQLVKEGQSFMNFVNTIGVCMWGTFGVSPALMAETLTEATGLTFTAEDTSKIGMRVTNLRRAFNIRNGLVPADDTLPPRYTEYVLPDGGAKEGSRIRIKPMVREYYDLMGWDQKTGKPNRKTLEDLGLNKEADDMWGKKKADALIASQ